LDGVLTETACHFKVAQNLVHGMHAQIAARQAFEKRLKLLACCGG
jgi:hypothetical protein